MIEENKFKYKNRDGKDITFTFNPGQDSVIMSDYGPYLRVGSLTSEKPNEISFIDPSGGPFIFVGMDFNDMIHPTLVQFLEDPIRRIVTKIENTLEGVTIFYNKVDKFEKKKVKKK